MVSKLRGRETELGFGTQVETPGSLLLSRVGSQHRGLVRATAHSGTLPGFCPAQNSIRWGGGRGDIGGWEALDPSSPFKECCLFRPLTSGLSLFFLISTALRGGDGDLDFCYRFGGPGPGRLETDPAVQMRIQRLAFAHREVERPSSCFLCSLSELYQCQEGKQFSA